jgi:membrane protein implicated in regulation of membrane protease activity
MSGLGYRARKRWALLILVVGLPLYVVAAVNLVALFERPPVWVELGVFVVLGIVWALPFRAVFRGVGREDLEEGGG